jgi:hypothetical protein
MSMASTFFRPAGVKETWSDHAEGGEINFSLGTGLCLERRRIVLKYDNIEVRILDILWGVL